MTVYPGPRLQVSLREAGLLCVFFFLSLFQFCIFKNGVGSWKSLEGFHSNYSQQLDGVCSLRVVAFFFPSFFFFQKENNMPLFKHQKGLGSLLPGGSPEIPKHVRNSDKRPHLVVGSGLCGANRGSAGALGPGCMARTLLKNAPS